MGELILRDSEGKRNEKKIDFILKAYAGFICTITRANPNVSQKEVLDFFSHINDEEKRRLGIDTRPHSDKSVTIKIPFKDDSSVCISFDYDSDVSLNDCLVKSMEPL